MEDCTLDIGMMFVSKCIMALLGFIFLPLVLAMWELIAVIFLFLAVPAWIAREVFPSIAGFINGFFGIMWKAAARFSAAYFKIFF